MDIDCFKIMKNKFSICFRDYFFSKGVKLYLYYRQTSKITRTLVRNKLVDHSDVAGALAVGAAPTTFSLST